MIINIKNRKSFIQLFRYGLVGIVSNLTGYLIYLFVTYRGGTPKVTMSFLYGVGATVSFWGNKELTFKHKGSLLGTGIRYVIVHCFGYFINFTILFVMVDKFLYPHQLAQLISIFVVATFLFLALKFAVFLPSGCSNTGGE